jgi:hypothetical protein
MEHSGARALLTSFPLTRPNRGMFNPPELSVGKVYEQTEHDHEAFLEIKQTRSFELLQQ